MKNNNIYVQIYESDVPIVQRNNAPGDHPGVAGVVDPENDAGLIAIIIETIANFLTKERVINGICISSSVAAIVTNIVMLAKMEHGVVSTTMVVGTLGLHIAALTCTLLKIYGVQDIALDVITHYANKMTEQYVAPVITKPVEPVQRNSVIATIMNWLKPVLSVLFFVVGFFLPEGSMDEWCKTINTRITASDKITNTASELSNRVLEDICGIDIYGSKLMMDRRKAIAEEGVELGKTPTEEFIRKKALRVKLFSYTQRATDCLSEKMPSQSQDKLVKALAPLNNIINNNIKILTDIIKTIEECTQLPTRPPTVGVLLAGKHGVGKSRFSKYAMEQIGVILGLSPDIYSVSRAEQYFDPYGGEHFGIHDEFLYSRSDDPIIPTLTKLVSSDYYNLEGAAIHNKRQTCELKMVSFTTNVDDPSNHLHKKISEKAVEAVWDRIVRVEVIDPKITTRHDPTGNLHRQNDYSHLTIKMTISTKPVVAKESYVEVTSQQYVSYFAYRVASSIKAFCDEHDAWDVYNKELINTYLSTNLESFQRLTNKLLDAAKIGRNAIVDIPSMSFTTTNGQKNKNKPLPIMVKGNSASRHFFVVRLEGKGGKGKTTTGHLIASKMARRYDLPVVELDSSFAEPSKERAIYIVDDILTPHNGDEYLQWINKTNPCSVIILITNIKYPTVKDWLWNTYIDVTKVANSSGIARRIGITGRYKHGNDYDRLSDIDATYVKMEDTMTVEGELYDSARLSQLIHEKYLRFVSHTRTITIVNDLHNITNPDIHITAKSLKTFTDSLQSKASLISGYISPSEKFSVKLSSASVINQFAKISSPDTFVITNIESVNSFKEHMKTMVEKMCIYKPDATVVVNITDEQLTVGYAKRCLYINEDIFDLSTIIKHHGDEIYMPKDGTLFAVNIKDLAMLKANLVSGGTVTNLTADELDIICRYIEKDAVLENRLSYYICSYKMKQDESSALKEFLNKNKRLISCVALVAGLASAIGAVYYMYRKVTPAETGKKNTAEDEDNAVHHKIIQKYSSRIARGDDVLVVKHDIIREFGEKQWQEAEWTMRNTAQDFVDIGDWKGLQNYWKINPTDMPKNTPNQVTPDMISFQTSNQIETLTALLETNTVLLVNKQTAGKNFGLGICGSYLVSVAHAVHADMDACYIISDNIKHDVVCIWLDRSRDLAIYKLVQNRFAFKDIRHHFGGKDLFDKTNEGYYIRPIVGNRTIAACNIRYTPKRMCPLSDGDAYFRPDTGLYTVLFATAERPIFLKRGDCGLPLVVRTDEGLRIVAIHNAITTHRMAFFASVGIEDFSMINEKVESNSFVYHYHKPATKFTTHEWYSSIIDGKLGAPKVPYCGLSVMGYSRDAHLPSFPKDSHRELLTSETREQIGERLPTKPSALKFKEGLMSPDKLIKDNKGIPHTLWTQSVKYTHIEPLYQKWDPKVKEITMDLIKQRFVRDYGYAKVMPKHININGDGTPCNKPWDMTTSGGPLLKKLYNIHTKEALFDNKATADARPFWIFNSSPAAKHVQEMYNTYTESLESGKPIAIWCKDNRKVELLPSAKVHEGKVRLFNELDFSVNMALKKYFGSTLTKILENHVEGPYKIGMDVYSEATIYYRNMMKIEGDLLSTDISGCDKTMPAEIIEGFCETALQGYNANLIKAIAQSLTYTIHIMDGIVYVVDKGNESGSYVTTALNCYGMEVITIYPVVEKLLEQGRAPTLTNVDAVLSAIYYGDDRSMKVDKSLGITANDLVRCGAYFNFKVTPAKVQSEHISFCSREFIPDSDGVVFPKLKETSVLSCLFWVKRKETKYIQANINVALFEAALHEEEFFNRVVKIVNVILTENPSVAPYIHIYEYSLYRKVFKEFIYNQRDGPVLLQAGIAEESRDIDITQNLEQLNISSNNYNTIINMDYVSHINNLAQNSNEQPKYEYASTGPKETPVWMCTASLAGKTATAQASTKKKAQQEAAKQLVVPNNKLPLKLNMQVYSDFVNNEHYFKSYGATVGLATIDNVKLSVNLDPDFPLDDILPDLIDQNMCITERKQIKIFIGGNVIYKKQITIENLIVHQNNDMPIEPAVMNQAAMRDQRANLPSQTNPQPTAVMPAMTHSGDDIMGAVTTALPETLNPVGAPDMLAVGAITFDIKDLIYQQFLDCDTQLIVSDDAVEGSIIAQIPYGLQSNYINSYIKYYAKAHERFNGSLQFRFTVIGNPLFSGAIGIAWYPKKIATATMPISELMKYSYQAEGVTNPWNKIHVLHDARREHFYRLVEDDQADYDNRPHLVIFLMMSLQNPLREGVQTRIRIASKLANSAEPNPFTFSNPDILTVTPSLATPVPGLTTAQGSNVPSIFPHTLNIDSNVFTDGNMAAPQVFDFGIPHRNLILNAPLNGARMSRIVSTKAPLDNFFQFTLDQKYRLYADNADKLGLATLYNISNVPRTQYNIFANALTAMPANDHLLTSQTTPSSYTGRDPDAFRQTLIKCINSLNEKYNTNKFGVVGLYYSSPDANDAQRFGLFKIITTHGVIILAIQLIEFDTQIDTTAPSYIDQWGVLTYNQIDVPYNIDTVASTLPSDYRILRISDQPVSAVIANTLTNPTATDDPSISMYYKRLSADVDVTQCYQFELQDPVSYRTIATVRYLQEFGIFVVRGTDMYSYLPQKFSTLVITSPVLINRSNGFPITDSNYWLSRTASTYLETKLFLHAAEYPVSVQRNASVIAGGMLSGLGAGLAQSGKNKHELKLQGNQLAHEKDMQASDQAYGLKYQKRGFLGQAGLAGINYKSNSALSRQQFEQSQKLAAQQQEFTKENQHREMLLSGARTEVSGATTAVSHA
ncbi:putative polyprotein [Bactrocera dorsalis picorna-like virus]|nr:putative polyprotein [Bactrocera dorsalis picorna-like virus]